MATAASGLPLHRTAADLHDHLGHILLHRIRLYPPPGIASLADILIVQTQDHRLCELVNGVLVEKTVGYYESRLALLIGYFLEDFLEAHDWALSSGPMVCCNDYMTRYAFRMFLFFWSHFPDRELPAEPIPRLVPNLAVEVLSASNTPQEMNRKLREYFAAGTQLVWYVDSEGQRMTSYMAPEQGHELSIDDILDGGEVLSGFQLSIRGLFDRAGRHRR